MVSIGLFLATVVLGLSIGDLYEIPPNENTFWWRRVHMLTGTAAAISILFVHSVGITYFVGTSRWVKEVTETYLLDAKFLVESTVLKRRTFPFAVIGMLGVVGIAALGAASDPGNGRPDTAWWADIHLYGAFGGLAFIMWTYYKSWLNIVSNQGVIKQVLAEVARIRQAKGLDTEDQPASAPESASS